MNSVSPQNERGLLDMIKIRTRQRCPKCGGKFLSQRNNINCPTCLTIPSRYLLDWIYQTHTPNGLIPERFRLFGFHSYAEALKKAVAIESEMANYKFKPELYRGDNVHIHKKFRFDFLYQEYIDKRTQDADNNLIAPSYLSKLEEYKNKFSYFEGYDVRKIKKYDIEKFLYSIAKSGIKLKTQKNVIGVLHAFLTHLFDLEILSEMPKFPTIKVQDPEWKWIDRAKQIQILQHIPEQHKQIFEFLFTTGLRPAEIRALKWKDIVKDAELPYIEIRSSFSDHTYREITKTKNRWQIPLLSKIEEILKKVPRRLGCEFVFNLNGKPYSRNVLGNNWRKACSEAKISGVTLYQGCRHSFASQRVNEGKPLEIIGAMMGHLSTQTTRRYAHIERLKAMKESLEG